MAEKALGLRSVWTREWEIRLELWESWTCGGGTRQAGYLNTSDLVKAPFPALIAGRIRFEHEYEDLGNTDLFVSRRDSTSVRLP